MTVKFKESIMTENVVIEVTTREEVDLVCEFLESKGQVWDEHHRQDIFPDYCYICPKKDDIYEEARIPEGHTIISFAEALQEDEIMLMSEKMPNLESGMIVDIDDSLLGECRGVLIEKDGGLILIDKNLNCMASVIVEESIQRVYKLIDTDNLCLAFDKSYRHLSLTWEKDNITTEEQLANSIVEELRSLGREKTNIIIDLLTKMNDK